MNIMDTNIATAAVERPRTPRGLPKQETLGDTLARLRYRYFPDHVIGEILAKRWMETAIPVILLIAVVVAFSIAVPGFLTLNSIADISRQAGEIGFVVLALTLVMIVGGIDLSVGSTFALSNLTALYFINVAEMPIWVAIPGTLLVGSLLGGVNGILIGYFRLRAFLTTLITLIVFRAAYDLLTFKFATAIASGFPDAPVWDFIGSGSVFGIPTVACFYLAVAIAGHIFLTRLRPGWHINAIGGSRRSAYNTGIAVRRTVALCYVGSGALTALGALFFASRLNSAGGDIGVGLEITVLTAAVLGGISLGGGKGSVTKAAVGTLIVLIVINGLVNLGLVGGINRMVLAATLLTAAAVDIRWLKNKHRIVSKVYVSPAYHKLPPLISTKPDSGTAWALNDKLHDVDVIGLGQVEGAEDVILDRHDNLYGGSRLGDIVRFFPPDYKRMEIYAHIGGGPLGMAFDKHDNLYVCVGGMGLYRVTPDRKVEKATDETNRSYSSVNDDSRLRLADDLDIADDGRIFFSEATMRYEMHDWPVDGLEARGNGRIICYDPNTNKTHTVLRNLIFPNGVCIGTDRQSFLFAESWNCTVKRYYYEGPKKGRLEVVLENLPGFPDNINTSSDGNYWMSLVGMRSPALDLAWTMPSFRRRMAKRVPQDEWLYPNVNTGCVLKFTDKGEVLETLWDLHATNHPQITSMREHKGYLFLGGLSNNRIGRYKLPDNADPKFVQYDARWKAKK